jgi:hypothetical protein
MIGLGMRSSPMRKLRRERSVCAPQKSIGWHSMGPNVSLSVRVLVTPDDLMTYGHHAVV